MKVQRAQCPRATMTKREREDEEEHGELGGGGAPGAKLNPIDKKTGKPSECGLCGSKYHWKSACPKNDAKEAKAAEGEEAHVACASFVDPSHV